MSHNKSFYLDFQNFLYEGIFEKKVSELKAEDTQF